MLLSLRKQPTFQDASTGSLCNDTWVTSAEIPYRWCFTSQNWEVLLIGPAAWKICSNQSEVLPRSGQWCIISMEFLHLFLRCHFAGKPGEASWNVGYFLRLYALWIWNLMALICLRCWCSRMLWIALLLTLILAHYFIHLIMVNQRKWVHALFKIHRRLLQLYVCRNLNWLKHQ